MKLAFVIPRFSEGLVGGAENLALQILRHLPPDRYQTEVWTTCALDHFTWADHFPPGTERIGDLVVRRFRTNERDLERFVHFQHRLHHLLPLSLDDELAWLAESVHSDDLLEHVARAGTDRDALVFLPYLFGVTLAGTAIHPDRTVLLPCLHDEPYAYLRVVRHLFESVRGLVFNSAPERDLALRLYDVDPDRCAVVGMGFDPVPARPADGPPPGDRFRRHAGFEGPYVLYFGRKEDGKNTNWLAQQFAALQGRGAPPVTLAFAGSGELHVPPGGGEAIVDVDFLDEELKADAIEGAVAVCQPSVNESFSIVIMEAWLRATPVLVHGRCAVTREHVRQSGGGLWFENAAELGGALEFLLENPATAARMGRVGRAYVHGEYGWPEVLRRFDHALERLVA